MTNTEALEAFTCWLAQVEIIPGGVAGLDAREVVARYQAQSLAIEVTVPAPGDLLDNGWLAEAGAVNDQDMPWTKVEDIVGYLGSDRPVLLDLEGDAYAERQLSEVDFSILPESYVTLVNYQVLCSGTHVQLFFAEIGSVAFPAGHALPFEMG